ncbi:hypothetical protein [Polynucleobacter sp. JS-JIR-5-A7]|uniref:hypothetical protein n=1 Tax=Polynucleobacter sp. JS-JIR-5-A7 TaxID=1758395 RepID=UPI001BFE2B7D|nr:hypothetical protein [Polynucleobacter sp. JS-JIR-5-A7]QWE06399.1 hypothetical protein AOC29_09880 [Polynucleobacter sp. JS-JIR-5-A7]
MDGRKGNEKKNETITFIFKNKKLDGFECLHWDKEKIVCSVDINKPTQKMTESLSFDRLSGVVNYKKFNSHSLINLVEQKSYVGKCEKVKENKF